MKIYTALDTETTGLLRPEATESHLQPFIIEIYICKFDDEFNIVDEFETFIRPPVPVPEEITRITGITNDMVLNAPTFIEVYDDLVKFLLGEEVIYAQNCTFDIGMLRNELARHDLVTKFPWPVDQRCTVELSFPIQNKRLNLEKLCGFAGIPYEKGHRAKNDVLMMIDCIKFLRGEGLDA